MLMVTVGAIPPVTGWEGVVVQLGPKVGAAVGKVPAATTV